MIFIFRNSDGRPILATSLFLWQGWEPGLRIYMRARVRQPDQICEQPSGLRIKLVTLVTIWS
jgi:hypothetical protein